jgi:hypothetical protein
VSDPAQPRLQIFDLAGRKTFVTSAENIAVERDFYNAEIELLWKPETGTVPLALFPAPVP